MKRSVLIWLTVMILMGCSRPVPQPPPPPDLPPQPPTPVVVEIPPKPVQAINPDLAEEPFWGPPGTTILSADGTVLSESLQPLPFAGRVLQPVKFEHATYLVHVAEGQLWQNGMIYDMIGQQHLNEAPAALASLPYQVGDTWAFWGEGQGPRVTGFEDLVTPAGTFSTVVVEESELGARMWWSPGIGLVKRQNGDNVLVADRVEQREPHLPDKAKQVTPDLLAIIANERIYDQTGRVLADFQYDKNSGRRPSATWQEIGAPYPVVRRGTHSQGAPNWKETIWVYEPSAQIFEPLAWHFPDGSVRMELVGYLDWAPENVSFLDDEAYPWATCTFEYRDGAMHAVDYKLRYVNNEAGFAGQLTRPLNRESFIGLFADPAIGEQAYAWANVNGWNRLVNGSLRPPDEGGWTLQGDGGSDVQFKLAPHGQDYRIIEWKPAG